jgi:hypothetical protein
MSTIAAVRTSVARLAHLHPADLDPLKTFLPALHHGRALHRAIVIVLGGRGTGKTALFRLVTDPRTADRVRALFDTDLIPDASFFDAFSTGSTAHPDVGVLAAHGASASDLALRAFWMTHLLRRLQETEPELVRPPERLGPLLRAPAADVGAWLSTAEAEIGAVSAALDDGDRALDKARRTVVATYDNLDLLAPFLPGVRRRYIGALVSLWLTLGDRYRSILGKVFLRDDLFDAAELGFADASKLRGRSERLEWSAGDLYRVIVRHLANGPSGSEIREWLEGTPGLELRDRGDLGWLVAPMPDSAQRAFAAKLAGRTIGRGILKGPTDEWMLARLSDARRTTTPRAMLSLVGFAAEEAERRGRAAGRGPVFGGADLLVALRQASKDRVEEIKEETPAAARLEGLRGAVVPLERGEALARLSERRPTEPDGLPDEGTAILGELLRVGVLRSLDDGRIDVPDIFRYAFDIGPDYVSAWRDFIEGKEQSAVEQFVREAPLLQGILRRARQGTKLIEADLARADWPAARAKIEQSLKLWEAAEDLENQAETHYLLAMINGIEGNAAAARDHAEQALVLARRRRDPKLEALTWMLLSWYRVSTADSEGVGEALRAAAEIIDKKDLSEIHATFFSTLAFLHVLGHNGASAGDMGRRAVSELRRLNDDVGLVQFYMSSGMLVGMGAQTDGLLLLVCLAGAASRAQGGAAADTVAAFWNGMKDATGALPDSERIQPLRDRAEAAWVQDGGESLLAEILTSAASRPSSARE